MAISVSGNHARPKDLPMIHYEADCGAYSLTLAIPATADLDGAFDAIDLDTGEAVRINGWHWTFELIEG